MHMPLLLLPALSHLTYFRPSQSCEDARRESEWRSAPSPTHGQASLSGVIELQARTWKPLQLRVDTCTLKVCTGFLAFRRS